jgi:hypothetical protein
LNKIRGKFSRKSKKYDYPKFATTFARDTVRDAVVVAMPSFSGGPAANALRLTGARMSGQQRPIHHDRRIPALARAQFQAPSFWRGVRAAP